MEITVCLIAVVTINRDSCIHQLISVSFQALIFPFYFVKLILVKTLEAQTHPGSIDLVQSFIVSGNCLLFVSGNNHPCSIISFERA